MPLFDTGQIVRSGQLKSSSAFQVFWLTRFRGCKVANTLQTPKQNFIGQMSVSKVWVLDPPEQAKPDA